MHDEPGCVLAPLLSTIAARDTPDFHYINDDRKVRPGGRVQQIWNTLRRYLLSVHARRDYMYFSTV